MRRRGHAVNIVHIGWPDPIRSLDDLPWIELRGRDRAHLPERASRPRTSSRCPRARRYDWPPTVTGSHISLHSCRSRTSSRPSTMSFRSLMGCRSYSCRATGCSFPRSRTRCSMRPVPRYACRGGSSTWERKRAFETRSSCTYPTGSSTTSTALSSRSEERPPLVSFALPEQSHYASERRPCRSRRGEEAASGGRGHGLLAGCRRSTRCRTG